MSNCYSEITNPSRKRKFPFEQILAGSSKIKVSETGIKMSHKLAQVFDRHMNFNYAGEAKLIGNLLRTFCCHLCHSSISTIFRVSDLTIQWP